MESLDKLDIRILSVLQVDGRISNQQLAERVNTSAASCWRRVRALESSGVIGRYAAVVDSEKVGFELCAFAQITMVRHVSIDVKQIEAAIIAQPEVLECYATTGDSDFLLRVVTGDIASYDRFLETFIFSLPGIGQVRSNIALREIKYEVALPLNINH